MKKIENIYNALKIIFLGNKEVTADVKIKVVKKVLKATFDSQISKSI